MVEVISWPCSSLRVVSADLFLVNTTRTAGVSLLGVPQRIGNGAQVWNLSLTIAPDFEQERVKAFEALVRRMRGSLNIAALCVPDIFRYDASVSPAQQPYSDGTYHSDGTGFLVDGGGVEPLATTAQVSAGARSLTVDLTNPKKPPLRVGDLFSVGGFLYSVVTVSGGSVGFEPAARAAIPSGAVLKTDPAEFYCRFADDMQGRRARLSPSASHTEQITLSFVEAFDR